MFILISYVIYPGLTLKMNFRRALQLAYIHRLNKELEVCIYKLPTTTTHCTHHQQTLVLYQMTSKEIIFLCSQIMSYGICTKIQFQFWSWMSLCNYICANSRMHHKIQSFLLVIQQYSILLADFIVVLTYLHSKWIWLTEVYQYILLQWVLEQQQFGF